MLHGAWWVTLNSPDLLSVMFFQILNDYPEELRGDVSMHLHKEILSLPIFETASEGCRKLLSLKIKTNFCAPDEFLIHKGDALHNIYYLYNGSMEVLQNGMVVAILGENISYRRIQNLAITYFLFYFIYNKFIFTIH